MILRTSVVSKTYTLSPYVGIAGAVWYCDGCGHCTRSQDEANRHDCLTHLKARVDELERRLQQLNGGDDWTA